LAGEFFSHKGVYTSCTRIKHSSSLHCLRLFQLFRTRNSSHGLSAMKLKSLALHMIIFLCKKTKFQRNPKALMTKVFIERGRLAPLMTGGIVILLRINKIKWDIVDLNYKKIYVKEQRVDGFPPVS